MGLVLVMVFGINRKREVLYENIREEGRKLNSNRVLKYVNVYEDV